MKKRVLSLALALLLLVTVAVPAFAAGSALTVASVTVGNANLSGQTLKGSFTITVTFSESMGKNAEATKKLITLKNGDTDVPIFIDTDGGKLFCFTVENASAGSYVLTVGKGAKADSGRTLAKDVTVSFNVEAESMISVLLDIFKKLINQMLAAVGITGGLGDLGGGTDIGVPDIGGAVGGIGDAIGGITGGGMPDLGGIADTVGGLVG